MKPRPRPLSLSATDDLPPQEFVELLLQVLDVPEVAEAVANAIKPHLVRQPVRITATDHPRAVPPPVTSRGLRNKR